MFFEVTAPVGALGLDGDAIPPETRVELEGSVAALDGASPTVAVDGDAEGVAAAFRANPSVAAFDRLGDAGDETVYRLAWGDDAPEVVERVRETDCAVLSGAGTAEGWSLELRFPGETAASRFYDRYDDPDAPITLRHSSSFGRSRQAERDALTAKQATALSAALAAGYFDVPRAATLADVASEVGVSDTAVSQRMRRGVSALLRSSPALVRAGGRAPADD